METPNSEITKITTSPPPRRKKTPILVKHKLKVSLENDDIQIVFDELKKIYKLNGYNNLDEIILLKSRYSALEKKVRNGLIELQDELREKQKIKKSLLFFINKIE